MAKARGAEEDRSLGAMQLDRRRPGFLASRLHEGVWEDKGRIGAADLPDEEGADE